MFKNSRENIFNPRLDVTTGGIGWETLCAMWFMVYVDRRVRKLLWSYLSIHKSNLHETKKRLNLLKSSLIWCDNMIVCGMWIYVVIYAECDNMWSKCYELMIAWSICLVCIINVINDPSNMLLCFYWYQRMNNIFI